MAEKLVPLQFDEKDIEEVQHLYAETIECAVLLVQKLRDIHPEMTRYKFTSGTIEVTIEDKDPQTRAALHLAEQPNIPLNGS